MIIAVYHDPTDTRVAMTPQAVTQYLKMGFTVYCEKSAGLAAGFTDTDYQQAGAILSDKKTLLQKANILLTVSEPIPKQLRGLTASTLLIGPITNFAESPLLQWCCKQQISVFSMNAIPRISRAQSMDSLSSQANLAGYRAVIEAIAHFKRAVPMMMTAAGMIQPAKVLVLGAGVAGLQAIATAKRLGAVVYAFDVRLAAKEQVESLSAEFIAVSSDQDAETESGYAREMSQDYQQKQEALIAEYAKKVDIIITTALIPGKKAPILLTRYAVEQMQAGSVVVDLATAQGGNCELSQHNQIIQHQQVTLIGYSNLAGLVPRTASELYANNILSLLRLLAPFPPTLQFNTEDDIIQQALLCHEGRYLPFHPVTENTHV